MKPQHGILLVAFVVVACSDPGRPMGSTGGGITTGLGTEGTGATTSEGSSAGSGVFDVGAGGTDSITAGDSGSVEGCKKVDFLFVVDSSGSMVDEQQNLLTSFPGFLNAIEQTLEIDDFQLMVIDAGAVTGAGCDGTLGAGRTHSGAGQDCGLVGGKRYATNAQPDLAAAFSCMAARGTDGAGNEETMKALEQAIGPLEAAGQCNEGFIRDDAVLVITIITDEEDSGLDNNMNAALDGSCTPADADANSPGDPASWYQSVITAKLGDPKGVVVLTLIGDCDVGGACAGIKLDLFNPNSPITGAEPAPRIREFATMFTFGSIGPVCAPDYTPFFAAAAGVIDTACDEWVPPG